MRNQVKIGLSLLRDNLIGELYGKKVALLCHSASVDENFKHIIDILVDAGIALEKIFAPEHGLFSAEQDQQTVRNDLHKKYKIPIVSLYGKNFQSLKPKEEELQGIDVVIIDLQDVGARYYTFVWTAFLLIEVAAEMGIEIWILDRPNPITAEIVEGAVQEEEFLSFVGLLPLAIRHGMTIAEILHYGCMAKNLPSPRIIKMKNYRRDMWFDETGLPWVMPSPNMPTVQTATVYPGMCLLEGTNISEGRGTTKPFEIFGAPFIDPFVLCDKVNSLAAEYNFLGGFRLRPIYFIPAFNKFYGKRCGGAQIHIVKREEFNPVIVAFAILKTIIKLYPDEFYFKEPPYEFESVKRPFDILSGSSIWREMLIKNAPLDEFRGMFDEMAGNFEGTRKKFLIYQ